MDGNPSLANTKQHPFQGFCCTLWIHEDGTKDDVIYNPGRIPESITLDGCLVRIADFKSSAPVRDSHHPSVRRRNEKKTKSPGESDAEEASTIREEHGEYEYLKVHSDDDANEAENLFVKREESLLCIPQKASGDMVLKQVGLQVGFPTLL